MTTDYTRRCVIVCPEGAMADANHLALVLGRSAADVMTFASAAYQDGAGKLYAVTSTAATEAFETDAAKPLAAPAHAPDADLTAAGRAQAMLYIYGKHGTEGAAPDRLWVHIEPAPGDTRAAMELAGVGPPPPVNINSSDPVELKRLDGVGDVLAQKIIAGQPWSDPTKLSNIDGISDAMVAGWSMSPGLAV